MKKLKQVFLKTGTFGWFTFGRKAKGLHLNRFVRDILRECNIPCPTCNEGDCNEPVISLVTSRNVEYLNAAGDKMVATVIDLPIYADNASAVADNYPVNGWYKTPTGEIRVVV